MDMEELWSKTREVLRAEVNAVVYNSLLGSNNLVPALLDGDTLVLRVVMDNLKLLITNQWYSTIVRALSQVAGHQMDVEILTQEEIEAACRMASVHEFILSLPDGYKTRVGALGDNLSAGEKQRIGLARAFLRGSEWILLDEPTSNVDSINEGIILKALQAQKGKKSILLVSHRESTMAIADRIYRVKDGRMSEI